MQGWALDQPEKLDLKPETLELVATKTSTYSEGGEQVAPLGLRHNKSVCFAVMGYHDLSNTK
jgi:hypothetical protein